MIDWQKTLMSDRKLKEAFEQIRPDDEAKLRMLNNILAAVDHEEAVAQAPAGQAPARQAPAPQMPARRQRSNIISIVMPIAACLMLAAIGVLAVSQFTPFFEDFAFGPSAASPKTNSDLGAATGIARETTSGEGSDQGEESDTSNMAEASEAPANSEELEPSKPSTIIGSPDSSDDEGAALQTPAAPLEDTIQEHIQAHKDIQNRRR